MTGKSCPEKRKTFMKIWRAKKIHSHDRNMAVNKFVKETQFTTNQNDL